MTTTPDAVRDATVTLLAAVQATEDTRARLELCMADLHAANVRVANAEKVAADAIALASIARTIGAAAPTLAQRQALARAAERVLATCTLPDVVMPEAPATQVAARRSGAGDGAPVRLVPQPVAPQSGGALVAQAGA